MLGSEHQSLRNQTKLNTHTKKAIPKQSIKGQNYPKSDEKFRKGPNDDGYAFRSEC